MNRPLLSLGCSGWTRVFGIASLAIAALGLTCAPCLGQPLISADPTQLLTRAEQLADFYNWYDAEPLYVEAEKGFAHGFVTLCDDSELQYKVDDFYSPECDGTIAYNDPEFGVQWGVDSPILSAKDMMALPFSKQAIDF